MVPMQTSSGYCCSQNHSEQLWLQKASIVSCREAVIGPDRKLRLKLLRGHRMWVRHASDQFDQQKPMIAWNQPALLDKSRTNAQRSSCLPDYSQQFQILLDFETKIFLFCLTMYIVYALVNCKYVLISSKITSLTYFIYLICPFCVLFCMVSYPIMFSTIADL